MGLPTGDVVKNSKTVNGMLWYIDASQGVAVVARPISISKLNQFIFRFLFYKT